MGLLRGSAGFTRFLVETEFKEQYMERYEEQIRRYAFRYFDEYSTEESSVGWVDIMNIFESDLEAINFFKPPYITLSLRVDRRRVPAKALRQHCLQAEKEVLRSEEVDFISKAKGKEIKEFIWNQLIKRALPNTAAFDMIWNTETSQLLFGSTVNKTIDQFSEFFYKTFKATLYPVYPYSLAWKILEAERLDPTLLDTLNSYHFDGGRDQ